MFSEMVVSLEYKNKLWNNFKKNVVLGDKYIEHTNVQWKQYILHSAQCTLYIILTHSTLYIFIPLYSYCKSLTLRGFSYKKYLRKIR